MSIISKWLQLAIVLKVLVTLLFSYMKMIFEALRFA